jgi:transposase InsO family protein
MISAPDRRKAVELIDAARTSGARLTPTCQMAGISTRTYQRWTKDGAVKSDERPDAPRPVPANKLSDTERQRVLDICHQSEYASLPPGQIVPRLADRGRYIASESSFYRILHDAGEQHHRGRSRKPQRSTRPKGYCATAPNQVWSWDITWLAAPIRGMFFYLYMIVDIYSRKIVAWEVHTIESADLSSALVQKAVLSEGCQLNPPVLHADNGGPQKGFTLKAKLEALGITASYSRPRVSNDNPYSESLFRTLKYRPEYPVKGFKSIDAARKWCQGFVQWYNTDHLHSALRYVTPVQRHSDEDRKILANRQKVYRAAKRRRPERWSQAARNWKPIGHVWLNSPKQTSTKPSGVKKAA